MNVLRNAVLPLTLLALAGCQGVAENNGSGGVSKDAPGVTSRAIIVGIEAGTPSPSLNDESLGWQLAFREANDSGGIHGRRVAVKIYDYSDIDDQDSEAITKRHYRNAEQAIADNVFALVNFGGPAVEEIAELALERKVPYLFPHSAMVDSRDNRYMFDSFPKYPGEARLMYRYLSQVRGISKIGIVHDQNKYGQDFADWLRQYADEFGYEFVGNVPLKTEFPEDLSIELRSLIGGGAQAVVMALYGAQGKELMHAKAKLGWEGRLVSVGPLSDEAYLSLPGDQDEGTLGFCHYPDPVHSNASGVTGYRAVVDQYAPGHDYSRYSLYGYVYGRLVVEGLRKAGRELTRESFIRAMERIENWESGDIMPPVTLSAEDHHAQKAGRICELQDGRFKALTDWVVAE